MRPNLVDDPHDDWPLTDGLFETLRLTAAPGTPVRPPDRRGHPSLAEPPQQVVFTPSWPLRLRLDPDGQPFIQNESWWRQKPQVPPCRLVWIGDLVPSSGPHTTPHVEALVQLFSSPPGAFSAIQLPAVSLPLLSVGRVSRRSPATPNLAGPYETVPAMSGASWATSGASTCGLDRGPTALPRPRSCRPWRLRPWPSTRTSRILRSTCYGTPVLGGSSRCRLGDLSDVLRAPLVARLIWSFRAGRPGRLSSF